MRKFFYGMITIIWGACGFAASKEPTMLWEFSDQEYAQNVGYITGLVGGVAVSSYLFAPSGLVPHIRELFQKPAVTTLTKLPVALKSNYFMVLFPVSCVAIASAYCYNNFDVCTAFAGEMISWGHTAASQGLISFVMGFGGTTSLFLGFKVNKFLAAKQLSPWVLGIVFAGEIWMIGRTQYVIIQQAKQGQKVNQEIVALLRNGEGSLSSVISSIGIYVKSFLWKFFTGKDFSVPCHAASSSTPYHT